MALPSSTANLQRVVDSLKLNPKRTEINASASKVKVQDMENAGVFHTDNLFGDSPAAETLRKGSSLTTNIANYIREIRQKYFNIFPKDNEKPKAKPNVVKVPMEVKSTIECNEVKTYEDVVDAITSIVVHFVSQSLGVTKAQNPLLLVTDRKDFQDAKDRMDKNHPRLCLESLVTSQNATLGPEERANGIKDSMSWFYALNLTAEPKGEAKDSEMTVQFIVGSVLRYLAQLPGCNVWSDLRINFPPFMKMNGKESSGHAQPDIATRPIPEFDAELNAAFRNKNDIKAIVEQLLQPVVILGEAKRAATGSTKPGKANDSHYTAQMAMAVYPSLVALILLYLNGEEFDPERHDKPLPKEFFIYGIYYDEAKVELYAHIPFYQSDSDGSGGAGWRFVQGKVATIELATLDNAPGMAEKNAQRRAQLAIAMQAVRDQGLRLYNRFTSPEYKHILAQLLKESSGESKAN